MSLSDIGLSDIENLQEETDIQKLKHAWLNEFHTPELLPFQTDLVFDILQQVQAFSSTIEKLEENQKLENALRLKLMKMDLSRLVST